MNEREFVRIIVQWYRDNQRKLPWRTTTDPYKVWLSEVILQQTRVAQGLPYYLKFIATFPTVHALAKAREQTVLRQWQGLGYYSRARNLHRCAKIVSREFGGAFPPTFARLRELPGIGSYTAAAIASIAFGQPSAVVDGNVFRVLSRYFGIDADISTPAGKKTFQEKANRLIPADQPGDFNQAMMEFGATHCMPRSPLCETCPLARGCVALRGGRVGLLPVNGKSLKVRARFFYYFIFYSNGHIGLKKRTGADIWKGLYDFHLVESTTPQTLQKIVQSDPLLKKTCKQMPLKEASMKHVLTHQILNIEFYGVRLQEKNLTKIATDLLPLRMLSMPQMAKMPKPRAITRFLESKGLLNGTGNG